jgi:glycosyltransferase involved in cell wall biosynthesis
MTHDPEVSVIIPVLDDPDRLRLCLQALARQTLPRNRFETIVIDNGPSDPVRLAADAWPGTLYAVERCRSSYAARNRGIAMSRGSVLAFTDADCLPAPDWLEKGLAALRADPPPALVAGRIDVFSADPKRPTAVECFERVAAFPQRTFVERWHFGATANVFTTRAVMDQIGPFNPELQSGGDMDWGRRVHAAGLPVVYNDTPAIAHPARRTLAELRSKEERVARGARALAKERKTLRRLLLDLFYDWPRPGEILRMIADSRLNGPGERLKVLVLALYVKALRTRIRLCS